MAKDVAGTISVLTSATDIIPPLTADDQFALINLGANIVWIQHKLGVAAVAEADNAEAVLAGGQTILHWRPSNQPYSAIAETATCKVNIVNRQGR